MPALDNCSSHSFILVKRNYPKVGNFSSISATDELNIWLTKLATWCLNFFIYYTDMPSHFVK